MTLGVSYEPLYIAASGAMSRRFEQLEQWWGREATRHFLWVPVCFAAGIALYYALPSEPSAWLFPLLGAISLIVLIAMRGRYVAPLLAASLLLIGASWADLRASSHPPIVLNEALSPRLVTGIVRDIERIERGVRLTIDRPKIEDLAADATPTRIRLSVKFKKDAAFEIPPIGAKLSIRAGLLPAMGPALPEGFDFARYFYARDIGAIGFGLPPWQLHEAAAPISDAEHFWSWRARLTDRIVKTLGPQTGGIAAGLITGDARAIAEADFESLRASNLYHIIAISGEHMVVIAGVIFISLRLLLLLLPKRWALRPQGKSIAAFITLALVTVYLFVTGLPISAVRAYLMIALVLLAVIARRAVDGLRSLAIAAILILLYDPASLLEPGFQLSFAATLAILALVESRLHRLAPNRERGLWQRIGQLLLTMLLVSVVAEAATTPLAISMFNNMSLYGVLANSLATPLVSLVLMPLVALFFILLPLGLESIALTLLDHGITALLALAHAVSSLPYAQIFLPSLPWFGLALFGVGLLWLCLWHTRVRRFGLVAMGLGMASLLTVDLPDILIGGGMKQIAFRGDAGYVLARGRANAMIPELWANGLGYKQLPKAQAPAWRCDAMGCVAQVMGQLIALPSDMAAMPEDCAQARMVITAHTVTPCRQGTAVVDIATFASSNVLAVWMNAKGGMRVESSADWQGDRPWGVRRAVDQAVPLAAADDE